MIFFAAYSVTLPSASVTSTFFPDSRGGIEEVIRQICLNTKPYGVESRVFTLSKNNLPEVIIQEGLEIFRAHKNFEVASSGFSFQAFLNFKNQVEWADVIHYHFPWERKYPYARQRL